MARRREEATLHVERRSRLRTARPIVDVGRRGADGDDLRKRTQMRKAGFVEIVQPSVGAKPAIAFMVATSLLDSPVS